jgi:hypothetical protein
VELDELADGARDDEDDVEDGAIEDGVTMTPLTFLGMVNAPSSVEDRYRATLFHWPQS